MAKKKEALQRGPGELTLSEGMAKILSSLKRGGKAQLQLVDVQRAERELGVVLPDDFWAAAAWQSEALATLGIGGSGEPSDLDEVPATVLGAASEAASQIDDATMVAILDISEADFDYQFLCVRRGGTFAERNAQEVFEYAGGERAPGVLFADWVAGKVEGLGTPKTKSLIPKLVGAPETRPAERWVNHPKFGRGKVVGIDGDGEQRKLDIDFEGVGRKILLQRFVTEAPA